MQMNATPLTLAVLIAATGCGSDKSTVPVTLAITHVTVIDGTGAPAKADQTVLISGNRITGIGPAAKLSVPRRTPAVDGKNGFLIPGLWDMHSHVTMFGPTGLTLFLANGVTGLRDMGAERFAVAKAWRDSIAAGQMIGPRMRIAGPIMENRRWLEAVEQMGKQAGTPWTLYERFGPRDTAEVIRWVDSVVALGADHIKVRNWPAPELSRALIDQAKRRGIAVVAHANEPFPRSGVTSFEHGIWPPLKVSDAARDSLWHHFAAEGTAFDPTLVTWPIRLDPPDTLLAKLDAGRIAGTEYVPAQALQSWRNQLQELKQETGSIDWKEVYRTELRNVAELRRAGVMLLSGSDIGAPLLVPGFSIHDELGLLVSVAGLTPMQALQTATLNPARVMKLSHALGTVELGKTADLVLLDADPLADIANTRLIRAVVANGRLFDRARLDSLLAAAKSAATERRP
jgi:imidazolonepropionase-like amidohydrolase